MGDTDNNGIYHYTEDDYRSLFSDLLNLGQEATSVAIGVLRGRVKDLEDAAVRPHLTMRRGGQQNTPVDGTAIAIKGPGNGAFSAPVAYPPVGQVGDVWSNQWFSWNRNLGHIRVMQNGYYDLSAVVQFATQVAGTIQLTIRKNNGVVAHDDGEPSPNIWRWLRPSVDALYLTPADVITIAAAAPGTNGLAMGNYATPAALEFSISLRRLA